MGNTASAPPRRIIFRANRETLALVVTACAATFTLSYAIHARPPEAAVADTSDAQQTAQQDWAGHLADVSTEPTPVAVEPMTSASLVVPKSMLAFPTAQGHRPRSCDGPSCSPKSGSMSRARPARAESSAKDERHDNSLLSKLNPLTHLPSIATLSKPFTVAGDVVSGWIKRF